MRFCWTLELLAKLDLLRSMSSMDGPSRCPHRQCAATHVVSDTCSAPVASNDPSSRSSAPPGALGTCFMVPRVSANDPPVRHRLPPSGSTAWPKHWWRMSSWSTTVRTIVMSPPTPGIIKSSSHSGFRLSSMVSVLNRHTCLPLWSRTVTTTYASDRPSQSAEANPTALVTESRTGRSILRRYLREGGAS